MDEAIRQAYQRKGPAVLILPKDFGWDKIEDNFRNNAAAHKVVPNFPAPRKEQVDKALELIKMLKIQLFTLVMVLKMLVRN